MPRFMPCDEVTELKKAFLSLILNQGCKMLFLVIDVEILPFLVNLIEVIFLSYFRKE